MKRTQPRTLLSTLFSIPLSIAFASLLMTLTLSAHANGNTNEGDCFPACTAEKPAVAEPTVPEPILTDAPCAVDTNPRGMVGQIEDLNDRVKPIKEIVGYVRSPQGLALKLVNDHVVKIPPWVGYAIDPVGSLKSRAMDEVRTRAKDAVGLNKPAAACPAIDTNLMPLDRELTV